MEAVEKDIVFRVKFAVDQQSGGAAQGAADALAKAQKAAEEAAARAGAAQKKAQEDAATAAARHAEAVAKVNAAYAAQAGAAQVSSKQGIEGFNKLLSGVLSVGRGLVAMKVASEENLESAVRMLAKFQGVTDLIKGSLSTIEGITKLWGFYTAAVNANTVAKLANNAADGGGGIDWMARAGRSGAGGWAARGAGGWAGTAAGAGVGGAAAAGGGAAGAGAGAAGGAAAGGVGALVASFAVLASIAIVVTAAIAGIAAIFSTDFREGLLELIGWTNKAADAEKKSAEMRERIDKAMGLSRDTFENQRQFTQESDDLRFRAVRGGGAAANARRREVAQSIFDQAQEQRNSLNTLSTTPRDFLQQQEATAARMADGAKRLVEVEEERTAIVLAAKEKEIVAARDVLKSKEKERDTAKQLADDAAKRVLGAEQKLAQLSPLEAQATAAAAEAARAGNVSFDQANRLRGLGLFDSQVQDADRKRVTELGLDSVLEQGRSQAAAAAANAQRMEVEAKVQSEMVVRLEADRDAFRESSNAVLDELFTKHVDAMRESLEAGFERRQREIDRKYQQGNK